MIVKSFRVLMLVMSLMSISLFAEAESLTFGENSPYEYFKSHPDERAKFLQQVMDDEELSPAQKKAYQALLGENKNLAGDDVLEKLDSEEIAWFYGLDEEAMEDFDKEKIYNAARIQRSVGHAQYMDCLSRPLCIMVSKSSQRLYAFRNGMQMDFGGSLWAYVSTARSGKITPNGFFNVEELAGRNRVSSLYSGAALYYAMQIHGNIFIHATSTGNYKYLGSRASAGCIRTRLSVAEKLNGLMREIGGRRSGVLANRSTVRVIVNSSIPNEYLQAY